MWLAAAAGFAVATPALADDVCPGATMATADATIPDPGGMPGNCAIVFGDGRVTLAGQPDGAAYDSYTSTTYLYDAEGRMVGETYSSGRTVYFGTPEGPMTDVTDYLGHTTRFAYDAAGSVLTATDPMNHVTTYQYDSSQRVVGATDTQGRSTTYGYNASGLMDMGTDPVGVPTTYAYDAMNRIVGSTTSGMTTTYDYAGGDLTQIDRPDGSTVTYGYDAMNRLATVTDTEGAGRTTTYGYDALNRVTTIDDSVLGLTTYGYDTNGNRLTVTETDSAGVTTYDYYNNLLLDLTDPAGDTYQYKYDAQQRLRGEIDPGGTIQTFAPVGVPETGTWALLLLGFGALGARLRRRAALTL
jgi:YD repeat-containing protein